MRNVLLAALLCTAALAGCSKEEQAQGLVNWQKAPPLRAGVDDDGDQGPGRSGNTGGGFGGPGANGGGRAPAPIVAAAPGTVPVRKAGLWQTTVNNGRGTPQTGQLCVDEQTELRRGVFSQAGGRGGGQGCEPKIAKRPDGSWTSTMSCTRNFGESSMKMSASQTLTGDLNARYQLKGTSTTSGGPNPEMNGTRQTSASGSYSGACPSGMKPGDFKGADGQVRNILQQGQGGGRRQGGPGDGEGRRQGGGAQ